MNYFILNEEPGLHVRLRHEPEVFAEICGFVGKLVGAADLKILIIPSAHLFTFKFPLLCGLESEQCLCSLWPKGVGGWRAHK